MAAHAWTTQQSDWSFLSAIAVLLEYQFWFVVPSAAVVAIGFLLLLRKNSLIGRVCALTVVLGSILFFGDLYPIGERHSLYLFPVLAIPAATAITEIFERMQRSFKLQNEWVIAAAVMLFFAAISIATVQFQEARESHHFRADLLFERGEWAALRNRLAGSVKSGDIVITNQQTAHYLNWETGFNQVRCLGGYLRAIDMDGITFYYDFRNWTNPRASLQAIESEIKKQVSFPSTAQIWMLHFGWGPDPGMLDALKRTGGDPDQEEFTRILFRGMRYPGTR
ncbi:MAG: hypothetical protein A2070_09175 [Bdellovibrionales bacterium GWC1_52_8]|nr:MAG: hypothetical protein A2X97_07960 [Bdellovibrionales bacterium GWA1_52_35]OFZ40519.1 MAG: hypothetical protein A2070_09175 [Bdellovibrionales bacterium GWC1_52_8]HCM41434.1 hypothetical protein [Bdellovibrionales bacterium]